MFWVIPARNCWVWACRILTLISPAERWSGHWRDLKEHWSLSFESRHRTRDGRIFPVEVSANYFEYGGRAYNLALVRDITERKRTEETILRHEAELRQVLDLMPDLVAEFDADRKRLYANRPTLDYFGITLEEWWNTPDPYRYYHPDDRERIESIMPTPETPLHMSSKHGSGKVMEPIGGSSFRDNPVRNEEGRITRWYFSATDIEDRKQAEQSLRQSEEYLTQAQRLTHTGSFAWDSAGEKFTHWSEEMFRIYGFDPQKGLPTKEEVFRLILPEDLNRVEASLQKAIREGADTVDEYTMVLPDKTIKHIQLIRHPVLDQSGGVVKLVGTLVDMTERKRAEEALRQSEQRLRLTLEAAQIGIFDWDVSHDVWYASPVYYTALGYEPREGPGDRAEWVERLHPDDNDRVTRTLQDILAAEIDRYEYEARMRHADGSYRWVQVKAFGIEHDSDRKVSRTLGVRIDITERKQAEVALRRSEAYLAEGQKLTRTGSFTGDSMMRPLYWSEEHYRIFGFDPQQGLPSREQTLERMHPEDLDKVLNAFDRVIHQKVDSEVEYRIVLPGGAVKWAHGIGHPVLSDTGELVEIIGTTVDITERKRAEEALRRSEAYLADSQRLTQTGSFTYMPGESVRYCSEEALRIWGFDRQQPIPNHEMVRQRIHPDDRGRVRERAEKALGTKTDWNDEFRIVLPDGTVKHIYAIHHPVFSTSGGLVEVVGTHVDFTERKRAEEALRESETRFRTFVDFAGDALFVYDLEHRTIVDVNRSACESLGCTRQELIGTTQLAFHLDSDRAEIESAAERAAAGETVFDRHSHRRKDGSTFPVEVHTSLGFVWRTSLPAEGCPRHHRPHAGRASDPSRLKNSSGT